MTEPAKLMPGDWVYCLGRLAKVRELHDSWTGPSGHVFDASVDLTPYNYNGERIGRWGPSQGGPRNFEPCCSLEGWARVEKPKFPIKDGHRYGITPGHLVFIDPCQDWGDAQPEALTQGDSRHD
jgi:hypothetical protein